MSDERMENFKKDSLNKRNNMIQTHEQKTINKTWTFSNLFKKETYEQKNNSFSKFAFYLGAGIIGSIRGGMGLILEHPLESIKTQWQDRYTIKSSKEIVNVIYYEKGLMGFYRGFVPNLLRVSSKQLYRWPLMLFFPRFFDKNIPEMIKQKIDGVSKICCGLSIANIEIFLITPLDRLKIYFMTNSTNRSAKHMFVYFYKAHKNNLLRELFRGLEPSFWRQNVSWVSFLYLDFKIKKLFKEKQNKKVLGYLDLFLISVLVGIGNLACGNFIFLKIFSDAI
jgi:hypothetical protein